jgi:single-strand DNA-binding protein
MAGETVITVVGNLTNDPELRFTPNGAAVTSFTVASTPRTLDRTTNEWKDGDALFLRCSIWRQAAEHVAESLQKGARVIVQGRLKQRKWTDREGNERVSIELDVDEIGPSLRYATAKVAKVSRGGGAYGAPAAAPPAAYGGPPAAGGPAGGPGGAGGYGAPAAASGGSGYGGGAVDDPWSAPAGAYSDEPPF